MSTRAGSLVAGKNLALLVVLAAVTALAFLLGRSLADTKPESISAQALSVQSGRLTLTGINGWESTQAPTAVRLLMPHAEAVSPAGVDAVTVLLGDLESGDLSRLISRLHLRDPVELRSSNLSALSFEDLPFEGDSRANVLLVATDDGPSAVLCVATAQAAVATTGTNCHTLLTTTVYRSSGGRADARPTAGASRQLTAVLQSLDSDRATHSAALASARTRGRQANAAELIAADYRRAAVRVAGVGLTTLAKSAGTGLVRGLQAGASGYADLARAADSGSSAGYRRAADRVHAADERIAAWVGQLRALGYARK